MNVEIESILDLPKARETAKPVIEGESFLGRMPGVL